MLPGDSRGVYFTAGERLLTVDLVVLLLKLSVESQRFTNPQVHDFIQPFSYVSERSGEENIVYILV